MSAAIVAWVSAHPYGVLLIGLFGLVACTVVVLLLPDDAWPWCDVCRCYHNPRHDDCPKNDHR